ncbi:MAG: NAD(P)/FAD-dependent oxidoreductase [Labilithrix sp.]|nr:NAD(P)/FAD-dependent oxidoreductase [Labilithrix sp.]MBX3222994.1 NAD(P)/FAD-dependent oxidoreductase [Labilithrix sp.]
MGRELDVVVVGARCAGATFGAFAAQAGKRVLVVDADDMPSDQPLSTHFIGMYGMSILDELGVGHRVRAVAPPVRFIRNGVDDAVITIDFGDERGGACIRRIDLDPMLVEEARARGAAVELKTSLVDVLRQDGRVVGAVIERDGAREEVRARWVVGADGRHSKLASLVGAEEYLAYDAPRAAFWAYWRRPEWFSADPSYDNNVTILHLEHDYLMVFPVNKDEVLVGVAVPLDRASEWRGRHEAFYLEQLRARPFVARFPDGERRSKVVSFVKGRYFFRRAAGPGWALVGDAGLFKDFTPGFGITDAFRDARALAQAIEGGSDAHLERYWRVRDVESVELFAFARMLGTPGYNNALNRAAFRAIAERRDLQARIIAFHERKLSPFALIPSGTAIGLLLGELFRGRFDAFPTFVDAVKEGGRSAKELRHRKALAASVAQLP